jgi:hypothetical protein
MFRYYNCMLRYDDGEDGTNLRKPRAKCHEYGIIISMSLGEPEPWARRHGRPAKLMPKDLRYLSRSGLCFSLHIHYRTSSKQ